MEFRKFFKKLFARLFGTVYTQDEVLRLVNGFLEDVRTKRLDVVNLRDAQERDRWCLHLGVAFEKRFKSKRWRREWQNDSVHAAEGDSTDK
jgi:hypothetical protein